jgi:osmoprotectant transport system permease protein
MGAGAGPGLMDGIVAFFTDPKNWSGSLGIPNRLQEHLVICGLAILLASIIAVPIGLYIGHTNRGSGLAINLANIGRAIPSYAMMVIPLPITLILAPVIGYSPSFGLVFLPPFLAMTFLAIPPLLVSTYAGLRSVDRDLIEAGRGMGLREQQILTRIEIPLASSILVGGFRTATLQVIATATIAAILGGGGLGRFIFDGLNQGLAGRPSIYAGAILVAALAIGVDVLLSRLQVRLTPIALRKPRGTPSRGMPVIDETPREGDQAGAGAPA